MLFRSELVVSAPEGMHKEEMALLKWCMDEISGWDVPLRSSGSVGANFGEMSKYED